MTSGSSQHVYGIIIVLTAIVGSILNGAAVWFFYFLAKQSKSLNDTLICSVAISDFLQCFVGYFLQAIWLFEIHKDPRICATYGLLTHWFSLCSITHLAIMAYERYRNITHGYRRPVYSFSYTMMLLCGAWFYSLFWSMLPLLGWSSYDDDVRSLTCAVRWDSHRSEDKSYAIAILIADFIIPLSVIVASYTKVYLTVHQSNETLKSAMAINNTKSNNEKQNRVRAEERNLILVVLLLIITFLLAWFPYAMVAVLTVCGLKITGSSMLIPAYLAKTAVLTNPIIYAFKHNRFKSYMRTLCGRDLRQIDNSPT